MANNNFKCCANDCVKQAVVDYPGHLCSKHLWAWGTIDIEDHQEALLMVREGKYDDETYEEI